MAATPRYPRATRRRSRTSRLFEGTLIGTLVGIFGLLLVVLGIVASAAPLVLAVLVLHWLGVF